MKVAIPSRGKTSRKRKAATSTARNLGWAVLTLSVALVVASALIAWTLIARRRPLPTTALTPVGNEVRIPTSAVADGAARFYHIEMPDETEIRFFVVQHPVDGLIHVALDAGPNTFQDARGYRQDGADMVCRVCKGHIPISRLNGPASGCTPFPITHGIDGDEIVLHRDELGKYATYFRGRR